MTKRADDAMFRDRRDAGRALAQALSKYKDDPAVIVVALPRGGVVIGYEISLALHLPLDVLVVRKLGTPVNPELAMGALAETGYRYLNEDVIRTYGVTVEQLDAEVRRQEREILRRSDKYRGGRRLPPLKGNTVLVVDDGIATGATLYAALAALRQAEAARLVVAVPVAPPDAARDLRAKVDEVVILQTPAWFFGISQFYERFPQVEDEEVIACLETVREALSRGNTSAG
ncbi:MAG: putative phosphoribosyltransferase [Nitrospira sp. OLB3]|nr:MAG: putative phosphoribosyltransferase [Nitrospira sp. OLB3]MCK6500061.1 phosphoribosyltransferase [Nitrospira sp.]